MLKFQKARGSLPASVARSCRGLLLSCCLWAGVASVATPAVPGISPGPGWLGSHAGDLQAGDRSSYELDLHSVLWIAGNPALTLDLRATWILTVVSSSADERIVHGMLDRPAVELRSLQGDGSHAARKELQRIRQGFETPHFLILDGTGAIRRTVVPADTPSMVQMTFKSLAGLSQLVRPKGDPSAWETTESDTSGRYTAEYESRPGREVLKRKKAYVRLRTEDGLAAPGDRHIEVLRSEASFTWSADGRPQSLELHERLRFSGAGALPGSESETDLALARTATGTTREIPSPPDASYYVSALHEGVSQAAELYERDLVKSGGRSLDAVLQILEVDSGSGRDQKRARDRAFLSLVSLLRIDNSAIPAVARLVEAGHEHSREIISALGLAASASAQHTLCELLPALPPDSRHRLEVLIALSQIRTPTRENAATLAAYLDDPSLGRQAHYGLGSLSHWLRDQDPKRSRRILEILLNRVSSAASTEGRALALRALGNAGHPAALEVVQPYLEDPDTLVRAAAVESLRLLPDDPVVDDLLLQRAQLDTSELVRLMVVRALEDRSEFPASGEILAQLQQLDPSRSVRGRAHAAMQRIGGRS